MNLSVELLRKYQLALWPAISIAAVIVLTFFVILPQANQYLAVQKTIQNTNTKAQALNDKKTILEQIDSASYESNLKFLLNILPQDKDLTSAVGQVQQMVNTSNLKIDNISFGGIGTNESFLVRLQISGKLSGIKDFVKRINSGPRIMRLSSIELAGSRVENSYSADISLNSFFAPLPQVLGSVEAPISFVTDKEVEQLKELQKTIKTFPVDSVETKAQTPQGKTDPFK